MTELLQEEERFIDRLITLYIIIPKLQLEISKLIAATLQSIDRYHANVTTLRRLFTAAHYATPEMDTPENHIVLMIPAKNLSPAQRKMRTTILSSSTKNCRKFLTRVREALGAVGTPLETKPWNARFLRILEPYAVELKTFPKWTRHVPVVELLDSESDRAESPCNVDLFEMSTVTIKK